MITAIDNNLIPQPIRDAIEANDVKKEDRSKIDYSVTQLIKSPREIQLGKRFAVELSEEPFSPIDYWYSFVGDAFHNYLESGLKGNDRYIVEHRIHREDLGRNVSGKLDCYDKETKTLSDHKTTTTFIFGKEMKDEWIKQLMLNAYLIESEGHPVDWVAINAVYVDWRDSKLAMAKEDSYPCAPATEFRVPAWSMEEREQLYLDLLRSHIEQEDVPTEQLPECSKDYCWERGAKWAVYKEGADKAIRVLDSELDAHKYIEWKKINNARIQFRPPTRMKCEKYCKVSKFCDQYREWLRSIEAKASDSAGTSTES